MKNKLMKINLVEIEQNKADIYIEIPEQKYHQVEKILKNKSTIIFLTNDYFIIEVNENQQSKITRDYNNNIVSKITEFKKNKNQDHKWKNEVIKNVNNALNVRGKEQMVKKIEKEWGYTDGSAVYATLRGEKGDIYAQDILVLEEKFGIHRDEILGELPQSDRKIYRAIENIITNNPGDELEIKATIREVIDIFKREQSNNISPNLSAVARKIRESLQNLQ